MDSMVVMGVAGCGKSGVAKQLARVLSLPFIEGDDFHPPANVDKMRRGIPLTDADRRGWLDTLACQLALPQSQGGVVMTCSALKRSYRERLRAASPTLRFVFLDIDTVEVSARLAFRANHFFSPALVDSQFEVLEPPSGERGVLALDARRALPELVQAVAAWTQQPI